MKKSHLEIVLENGYVQSSYGYKKIVVNVCHWLFFHLSKNRLYIQMYAYDVNDCYFEKEYDTGKVVLSEYELQIFIDIFTKNKNQEQELKIPTEKFPTIDDPRWIDPSFDFIESECYAILEDGRIGKGALNKSFSGGWYIFRLNPTSTEGAWHPIKKIIPIQDETAPTNP